MSLSVTALLTLALFLGGCATHEPPRCTGTLEPINAPPHAQTVPGSHGH
jgi:hypothetical protein